MPGFVKPMKAEALGGLDGTLAGWIAEPKLDGWRCIAGVHDAGAWLETATGTRINSLPYLNEAVATMFGPDTVLDGELVDEFAPRDASWNRVQTLARRDAQHRPSEADPPLTYFVFDLLVVDGEDAMGQSLRARKRKLLELFDGHGASGLVKPVVWKAADPDVVESLIGAGYEGAVLKDLDSHYRPGVKGHGWYKIKRVDTEDLVCTGTYETTPGSKYDGRAVGGLLCDRGGTEIRVGTGFNDAQRIEWFTSPPVGSYVEVAFNQGATGDSGQVRHASFVRVRDTRDKAPSLAQRMDQVREYSGKVPGAIAREIAAKPRKQGRAPATVNAAGASRRNYSAMKDEKLLDAISSLRAGHGDAYQRCVGVGADPAADLAKAQAVADDRGI